MANENLIHTLLWVGVGSLFLTAFLVPLVKLIAVHIGAVDRPNERKVHQKIMPRMGGLAFYIAFWVSMFLFLPFERAMMASFIGATLLVAVGVVDDMTDMPATLKLVGQIIAAGIATAGGVRIEFLTSMLGSKLLILDWLSIPVTIIWIVAIVNAINLIDGLDGLAAGVSAIAALTMAIVSWQNGNAIGCIMGVGLMGACIGFLFYNFSPASIFMGDTGSMFLGYTLAIISTQGAAKGLTFVSVVVPVMVLGVPIFDTLFAILRRSAAGQPVFKPDKAHLHHCLMKRGFGHRQVVLLIYAISASLSACALLVNQVATAQAFLIMLAVLTLVLLGANRLGIIGTDYNKESKKEQKK